MDDQSEQYFLRSRCCCDKKKEVFRNFTYYRWFLADFSGSNALFLWWIRKPDHWIRMIWRTRCCFQLQLGRYCGQIANTGLGQHNRINWAGMSAFAPDRFTEFGAAYFRSYKSYVDMQLYARLHLIRTSPLSSSQEEIFFAIRTMKPEKLWYRVQAPWALRAICAALSVPESL